MDKDIIVKLEELVESISECYTSIPTEIVAELNELTKNNWTTEQYIEYCAEYWSRSTLEETVYALLHDGEYPENVEEKLVFWKNKKTVNMSDEKIMFSLMDLSECVDEDFVSNFEDLPIKEFYSLIKLGLLNWTEDKKLTEEEIQAGAFEVTFDDNNENEYAKYGYVMLEVYGNKMIRLDCCNLPQNERQDIILFANKHGLYVYEN